MFARSFLLFFVNSLFCIYCPSSASTELLRITFQCIAIKQSRACMRKGAAWEKNDSFSQCQSLIIYQHFFKTAQFSFCITILDPILSACPISFYLRSWQNDNGWVIYSIFSETETAATFLAFLVSQHLPSPSQLVIQLVSPLLFGASGPIIGIASMQMHSGALLLLHSSRSFCSQSWCLFLIKSRLLSYDN